MCVVVSSQRFEPHGHRCTLFSNQRLVLRWWPYFLFTIKLAIQLLDYSYSIRV